MSISSGAGEPGCADAGTASGGEDGVIHPCLLSSPQGTTIQEAVCELSPDGPHRCHHRKDSPVKR